MASAMGEFPFPFLITLCQGLSITDYPPAVSTLSHVPPRPIQQFPCVQAAIAIAPLLRQRNTPGTPTTFVSSGQIDTGCCTATTSTILSHCFRKREIRQQQKTKTNKEAKQKSPLTTNLCMVAEVLFFPGDLTKKKKAPKKTHLTTKPMPWWLRSYSSPETHTKIIF